ncbi:hypothetical protein [Frankia sp. AgB32]|uniref:hypothetical protein n=1 Tax=Frankia sp. AgB32 TaxID=631119 RepID=UPI00200EEA8B|nr:hypothetical protein [Frankia sp. AgB32]MCK9894333.1 hypothetical protein [Frankia sp. AgB32]
MGTDWSVNGGTARLGRAATFSASSVCLAVVAHVAGGAASPGLCVTAVSFLLLARLAFGLGGRERGLAAVLSAVVAAQFTLHVTFLLAEPHAHMACFRCAVDRPTLVAHAVAAVAVALSLRRAERLLWSVVRLQPMTILVRLFLPVTEWSVPVAPSAFRVESGRRPPRAHTRPIGRSARRRGPPPVSPEIGRAVACGSPCVAH